MNKYIEFGKVLGTHGLKGQVVMQCFFESVEYFIEKGVFIKTEQGFEPITIKKVGIKKGGVIIEVQNSSTKESADKLLKLELFIERSTLNELDDENEETHFVADLLELNVFIEGEEEIFGKVNDVVNFGGGPLLEIAINLKHKNNIGKKEKLEYYEKSKQALKEVNLKQGYIILKNYDKF